MDKIHPHLGKAKAKNADMARPWVFILGILCRLFVQKEGRRLQAFIFNPIFQMLFIPVELRIINTYVHMCMCVYKMAHLAFCIKETA